jgi:hypothetical protein
VLSRVKVKISYNQGLVTRSNQRIQAVVAKLPISEMTMEINKGMLFNCKMRYELSANDTYTNVGPIILNFKLENLSNEDLWVLIWYTPLEGLKGKILRVACDGKEIAYEGPMMKRGHPVKSDYIHIESGKSVSKDFDMSTAYRLRPCQQCVVEFNGRIYDSTTSLQSIPRRNEEHRMVNITGEDVTFSIVNN